MSDPFPHESDFQDMFLDWLRFFDYENMEVEECEIAQIKEYRSHLAEVLAQQVELRNEAQSGTAKGIEWFKTHRQLAILCTRYKAGNSQALIEAFLLSTQTLGFPPVWILEAMHARFASWYEKVTDGIPMTLDEAFSVHARQNKRSSPTKNDRESRRDGTLCFETWILLTVIPELKTNAQKAAKLVCERYTLSEDGDLAMIQANTLEVRYSSTWKPRFERSDYMNVLQKQLQELELTVDEKRKILRTYPGGCDIAEELFPATLWKICLKCEKEFEARKGEHLCIVCKKENTRSTDA